MLSDVAPLMLAGFEEKYKGRKAAQNEDKENSSVQKA